MLPEKMETKNRRRPKNRGGRSSRERPRERQREKKNRRKTKIRTNSKSRKRDKERGVRRGGKRTEEGTQKKKKEITDTETSRGSISIGGGRLTLGGPTTHCSPPPPPPPTVHFFQLYPFQLPLNLTRAPRRVQIRHRTDSAPSKTRESVNVRSSRGNRVSPRTL